MSMPNIPDICPKICIDREDAINLLLASIAMEEFGLADLIDAESKKIKFVLGVDDYDEPSMKDVLEINKSVNSTIKDIIKLQMLLQFKLENVMELTSTTSSTTTFSTTTKSTTTTTFRTTTAAKTTTTCRTTTACHTTTVCRTTTACHTTTICKTTTACHTSSYCTTACLAKNDKMSCKEHVLKGTGFGEILNVCDPFFGGTATLKPYVSNKRDNGFSNSITYMVKKGNKLLTVNVFPDSISVDAVYDNKPVIIIRGIGAIEKKTDYESETAGRGSFELKVWESDMGLGCDGFQMKIMSQNKIVHDSGMVKQSGFHLNIQYL